MKPINANSKIADILREHPGALETIVGLSPRFRRLRNPVLRRLLAGRTTLAMASKMGGCTVADFYNRLRPLGFVIDDGAGATESASAVAEGMVPAFMLNLSEGQVVELDVRPMLEEGADPLGPIMEKVRALGPGKVLKIVAPFQPEPLIRLLEKKGFESWSATIGDELVHNWFRLSRGNLEGLEIEKPGSMEDWGAAMERFAGKLVTIDVRRLEMPLPMVAILEALDHLPGDEALFVHHKRIPVFLLPELAERKLDYRIREIGPAAVQLLIFKDARP